MTTPDSIKSNPLIEMIIDLNDTPPTLEQIHKMDSETAKYRHLTAKYCVGCGIDIGSQGSPVVPWALSFDVPIPAFKNYNNVNPAKGPIHFRGWAESLPFEDEVFDFVYSSHLIEDFETEGQIDLLIEWSRVLRRGGNLIIVAPEFTLWKEALLRGQPPNNAHKREPNLGELSVMGTQLGLKVVEEKLTNVYLEDYSLLAVFKKP